MTPTLRTALLALGALTGAAVGLSLPLPTPLRAAALVSPSTVQGQDACVCPHAASPRPAGLSGLLAST